MLGTAIFSRIDLVKAFRQISITPCDIHKTAIYRTFGLFESSLMQFGLYGALRTFTRLPEIISTDDMTAETTVRDPIKISISIFGYPVTITTNKYRNFEFTLIRNFCTSQVATEFKLHRVFTSKTEFWYCFEEYLKSSKIF